MQIFGGGTDTTSYTLNWIILFLCRYPEVQKKVQQEIELVFGKTLA